MQVSQARIDANRRNAALSTGPKTAEGKAISRANALKHGLCASAVVAEDVALIQQRSREFFDTMKPQNEVHVWMVEQAALASIRIDRCQRIERRVRDKMALRAELTWDVDRRFEVEVAARHLSKDPFATVQTLRQSYHGCEWLIRRWAMLAYAADTQNQSWTDDQTKLAFDLLATPYLFREGRRPGLVIDDDGRMIANADNPAEVARREIAALKTLRDDLDGLDESERHLASSDLVNDGDPELRRLRRYESSLHSKLKWSIKQIDIQSPYRLPEPYLRPKWANFPDDAPEPIAETPTPVEIVVETPPEPETETEPETEKIKPPKLSASVPTQQEKKSRRGAARTEAQLKRRDHLRA